MTTPSLTSSPIDRAEEKLKTLQQTKEKHEKRAPGILKISKTAFWGGIVFAVIALRAPVLEVVALPVTLMGGATSILYVRRGVRLQEQVDQQREKLEAMKEVSKTAENLAEKLDAQRKSNPGTDYSNLEAEITKLKTRFDDLEKPRVIDKPVFGRAPAKPTQPKA